MSRPKAKTPACVSIDEVLRREYELIAQLRGRQAKNGQTGAPPEDLSALCLSGGGIRSATFSLGVIQGLAKQRLLAKFDYLSTVSGGGYVGSWLEAWVHHSKQDIVHVESELRKPVEPEQLKSLRRYTRYLSPQLGLFSLDTWTLVAIYIRNLCLNWLVFIPLLLSVVMLPRLYAAIVNLFPLLNLRPSYGWLGLLAEYLPLGFLLRGVAGSSEDASFAGQTAPLAYVHLLYVIGVLLVAFAIFSAMVMSRNPRATLRCFLWRFLFPLIAAAISLSTGWAWDEHGSAHNYGAFVTAFAGLVAVPILARIVISRPAAIVARNIGEAFGVLAQRGALNMEPSTPVAFITYVVEAIATGVAAGVAASGLWLSAWFIDLCHDNVETWFPNWPKIACDGWETAIYVCAAPPLALASFGLGAMFFVGLTSRLSTATDGLREWWSRCGACVLLANIFWIVTSTAVLFGPVMLSLGGTYAPQIWSTIGGISGLITLILGKSSLTRAAKQASENRQRGTLVAKVMLRIAAPLFLCIFVATLSVVADALVRLRMPYSTSEWSEPSAGESLPEGTPRHVRLLASLEGLDPGATKIEGALDVQMVLERRFNLEADQQKQSTPGLFWMSIKTALDAVRRLPEQNWENYGGMDAWKEVTGSSQKGIRALVDREWRALVWVSAWTAGLFFIGIIFGLAIDINRFSLHATYRNRLVRAYLGAARGEDERTPNPFTGFDEDDDVRMCAMMPSPRTTPQGRPLHIINIAMNLVSSKSRKMLAWQDRKAKSFTVSPLHCGSADLGFRRTFEYGGGIKLGTALAISGAAISPNMGYHSSPALSFLLALFNVRLGWWLGNPRSPLGDKTYSDSSPLLGVWHLLAEALGETDEYHKFVYLSDGGHFENLGLYEMVRRRCKTIVVCDAGADPACSFEDLGNAIRKIRIDIGASIKFDPAVRIVARDDCKTSTALYCAVGTIVYPPPDRQDVTPPEPDGRILYLKPAFYEREPVDITNYGKQFKSFPHEPTANQFFTESQFESYRALGEHIVSLLQCDETEPACTLDELFRRAVVYVNYPMNP